VSVCGPIPGTAPTVVEGSGDGKPSRAIFLPLIGFPTYSKVVCFFGVFCIFPTNGHPRYTLCVPAGLARHSAGPARR